MRLFVAAWPDEETRERLSALDFGRGKGLRLVGPSRWHVTLRFLGDVDGELVDGLGAALARTTAALAGPLCCRWVPRPPGSPACACCSFPRPASTEVAAAVRARHGPARPDAEPDEPPFNGHLTLARAKGRLGPPPGPPSRHSLRSRIRGGPRRPGRFRPVATGPRLHHRDAGGSGPGARWGRGSGTSDAVLIAWSGDIENHERARRGRWLSRRSRRPRRAWPFWASSPHSPSPSSPHGPVCAGCSSPSRRSISVSCWSS